MFKIRKEIFEGINSPENIDEIVERLNKESAILSVEMVKNKFSIRYNLMGINLETIHQIVLDMGYTLPSSFFQNFRRKFIYLTDKNEYENSLAQDTCQHGGG